MASKVEKRIAFAFPVFRMERLAIVMPTCCDSSVTLIFRFANMTSILMIIAILRTSYRKVVFLLDCDRILQEFLKDSSKDGNHHAGENDDQADQDDAGSVIHITHHKNERHEQDEQPADRSRTEFDVLQDLHRQIGKSQVLIDVAQQFKDLVQGDEIDAGRCVQSDHEWILQISTGLGPVRPRKPQFPG